MKFFYSFLVVLFLSNAFYLFGLKEDTYLKILPFDKGSIQLQVENIHVKKGAIKVALFNSEDSFLINEAVYQTNSTEVGQNDFVTVTFANLPYGTYTAAVYHDVNSNNQLDKNIFGVPKEPYGFSNNAISKWGPPKYEAAKFQLNQVTLSIRIAVKKWSQQ